MQCEPGWFWVIYLLQILYVHARPAQTLASHLSSSSILSSASTGLLVLGTVIFVPHYSPQHTEGILDVGIIMLSTYHILDVLLVHTVCLAEWVRVPQPRTLLHLHLCRGHRGPMTTELRSAFQSTLPTLCQRLLSSWPLIFSHFHLLCFKNIEAPGRRNLPIPLPFPWRTYSVLSFPFSAQASFYALVSSWRFFCLGDTLLLCNLHISFKLPFRGSPLRSCLVCLQNTLICMSLSQHWWLVLRLSVYKSLLSA